MGSSTTGGHTLARAITRGAGRLAGFGLSVLLLAVASLLLIPAIISAGGQSAWGSIAVGQSIGTIAAVAIYFGWGHTGPAMIARADRDEARREFAESLKTRMLIFAPVTVVAAGAAAFVAPDTPALAVVGCVSASSIGLTADWYFVGRRRPYLYLVLETVPRVMGTVGAVLLLAHGAPVVFAPLSVLAGMLIACAATSCAVLLPRGGTRLPLRPVTVILRAQRHGVASGVGSAVYAAAPLVLVSVSAPAIQPTYALIDKLQRQLSVALAPAVSVVQGYVPERRDVDTARRARLALLAGGGFCLLLFAAVLATGPILLDWLGAGRLQPPYLAIIFMAAYVAVNVWESFLARAVLAAYGLLSVVARGTAIGAAVGLPLVVVGAVTWGVVGACGGVFLGLVVRTCYEAVAARRHGRRVIATAATRGGSE